MKIGVIVPHRNDRPEFLSNLKRMLNYQTVQPDLIHFVDYEPESNKCDITQRYRRGYDFMRNKGLDVIFLMEVDDWYSNTYIEYMLAAWNDNGKPDIFGTNYTIYYHIKLFAMFTFNHIQRSSAMSTMIKPDLTFPWCIDEEPFTDTHIWKHVKGRTFCPSKQICLGIKHGTSMTGGQSHIDRLHRYIKTDHNKDFIREIMDKDSYNFYSTAYENIINSPK